MTLLNDFIIVDNFFDAPDMVADYAKTCAYYESALFKNTANELETITKINDIANTPPGRWRGYRTQRLQLINRNLFLYFLKKLKQTIVSDYHIDCKVESYFHFSTENIKYDDSWWHSDTCSFAGVVYLTKNPPINSGTVLRNEGGEDKVIENVYNRFLLYNASILHRPEACFGNSIDDARLTLTFYIDNIKIKSRYSKE